jgi:periplasmic divalent cation tolerance protein
MPVASVYRWKGVVERAGEVSLHIKTSALLASAVESRILALHSYDLPEVVTLSIAGGSPAYLAWMMHEVG